MISSRRCCMKGQVMLAKDVLQELKLGNSVAEFDGALQDYFIETSSFHQVINDEVDIVARDKGTGKTALFLILQDRYAQLTELHGIELVPAFNPQGNPIFHRLTEDSPLQEADYIYLWKTYILSLLGNWILELVEEPDRTAAFIRLNLILRRLDLRSLDDSPQTIFSKIVSWCSRVKVTKASAALSVGSGGMPVMVPTIEFGDLPTEFSGAIPHDYAFGVLNECLEELDLRLWTMFDRLDEAFQGAPAVEIPALRGLFRTYLDLLPYTQLKLKLFVRRDLFRRIVEGGFVNLTHINARRIDIIWEDNDLWDLLYRRISENKSFLVAANLVGKTPDDIWAQLFPPQVDTGSRKPLTWSWMMRRARDGNGVLPPRNLIDLVREIRQVQLRRDEHSQREFTSESTLMTSDAIKRGLARMSDNRVQDTLLAPISHGAV